MTIKKSLPIKIIAFLLAVVCLAGCAVLGCYQLMEIDVLWGGSAATSSRQVMRLHKQNCADISYLIQLRNTPAEDLTSYEQALLEDLEERFAPENTNLRWQLRDAEDNLLHGNIAGELPAEAYNGYWYSSRDSFNAHFNLTQWLAILREYFDAETAPHQVVSANWAHSLKLAVDSWLTGEREALDPDAIYLSDTGVTNVLFVDDSGVTHIFAPTIRSVLEINEYGFRYDPEEDAWIRTNSGRELHAILWLDEGLSVQDEYLTAVNHTRFVYFNRIPLLAITAGLALVWLILTVCLCVWSGWRKGHDGVSLCWFHRIPGDLLLACYILLGILLVFVVVENAYYLWEQLAYPLWAQLTIAGLAGGAAAILLTSFLVTFVARCKGGVILRNMIVVRIIVGFVGAVITTVRSLPLIWKTALGGAVYLVLSIFLLLLAFNIPFFFFLWALLTLLVIVYLCWWAVHWKKIRQATDDIIDGIIDCHIDTRHMPPDLKEHANELNSLNETIAMAVEEQLRSEHFKAELITNVSHDLKTPLTSIINYVDLLKKEEIDNPKAAEYIEVLDRKSQRLKKLTEDLVEASKASTGNMAVELERLDLVQFADQALAEYQERLEGQRLSIVRTLPAEPVWVRADGRHLWRIMDNLLSNCAKYALEGTRVYAEVEQYFDCAELSIKNISREALNIDPSDLMERFVRGDESRTTEGSGLGLSIARSLTDLQNGHFFVSIDGDLFKATIRLPLADVPGFDFHR